MRASDFGIGGRWKWAALSVLLAAAATQAREPYLYPYRPWDALVFGALALLTAWGLLRTRQLPVLALLLPAVGWVGFKESTAFYARYTVRDAPTVEVEQLAAHLVVGFSSWREAEALAQSPAVGGLFVSSRNVRGLTPAQVAAAIEHLQAERRKQGRVPLIIATDQEGGVVSRLSPPLSFQPSLAEWVQGVRDPRAREARVRDYAATQATGLRALGVTVNLAPVLDLDWGVVLKEDRFTRVYARALSSDANIAAAIGTAYCDELERRGVYCVAKHFPGLGRVVGDTHLVDADLPTEPRELEASDWIPFRKVITSTEALLMVAHARFIAIDPQRPASLSPTVLKLLRNDWGYNGVLITDDMTMRAARNSREGLRGGPAAALEHGMDLLLVSYDPDLLWPVLAGLLAARESGQLTEAALQRSKERLQRLSKPPRASMAVPKR
jgi:beta-N-acetylhexosaminidase